MLHIAMIGKWHVHAEGYANQLKSAPGCRIDCVFDEDPAVAAAWAESLNCRAAKSYEEILRDPEITALAFGTATRDHEKYIIPACDAGKAVFTEKVLAITAEGAECIRDAVKRNNTLFAISLPHKCDPMLIRAAEWVKSGKLGKITYARVRNVHDGSLRNWLPETFYDPIQCGGGAMMDLGAHPMYTLCMLLGTPVGVQSAFTSFTGRRVEDNAVSLLRFADGAIGVSETGFVSENNPYTLEVSGTLGALRIWRNLMVCCPETDNAWTQDACLPPAPPSPLIQWANAAQEGKKEVPGFDIDEAVRLSRVMDAAYKPQASVFAPLPE